MPKVHRPAEASACRFLAYLSLAKIPGLTLLPLGALLGAAIFPTAVSRMWTVCKAARWVMYWGCFALVSAVLLRWLWPDSKGTVLEELQILGWIASLVLVPGFMLSLATVLDLRGILRRALLAGTVTAIVIAGGLVWKGDVGIYATSWLLVLAGPRVALTRTILILSAVVSAANDARGMALFCVIALFATLGPKRRLWMANHPVRAVAIGALVGTALVWSYFRALLAGVFGADAQLRTELQLATGNLFLASRAEFAAGWPLVQDRPGGYGVGVTAPDASVGDALSSVRLNGGDYTADYWRTAVFSPERHDFHSTVTNLWYHAGIAGVVLAVAILILLAKALPIAVAHTRTIGVAPLYILTVGLWDIFFSPMGSATRLTLAIFVAAAFVGRLRWNWTARASTAEVETGLEPEPAVPAPSPRRS